MSTMKVTFLPRYRWRRRVFCRIINQVPLQIDSGGRCLRMDLSLAWLMWISPFNWRLWSHKTTSKDSPSAFLTGVPNVLHLCEICLTTFLRRIFFQTLTSHIPPDRRGIELFLWKPQKVPCVEKILVSMSRDIELTNRNLQDDVDYWSVWKVNQSSSHLRLWSEVNSIGKPSSIDTFFEK